MIRVNPHSAFPTPLPGLGISWGDWSRWLAPPANLRCASGTEIQRVRSELISQNSSLRYPADGLPYIGPQPAWVEDSGSPSVQRIPSSTLALIRENSCNSCQPAFRVSDAPAGAGDVLVHCPRSLAPPANLRRASGTETQCVHSELRNQNSSLRYPADGLPGIGPQPA